MAIVGQLRSNDFAPGRAAKLAPDDIDASAPDTLTAVLLDCKHINPLH
jgi:hypothetical protein